MFGIDNLKIKLNESKHIALKREIKEELDIQIIIHDYLGTVNHKYSHFEVDLLLYRCSIDSGEERALQSQALKWIQMKQIKQFAFPKGTHKLFNLIRIKHV